MSKLGAFGFGEYFILKKDGKNNFSNIERHSVGNEIIVSEDVVGENEFAVLCTNGLITYLVYSFL